VLRACSSFPITEKSLDKVTQFPGSDKAHHRCEFNLLKLYTHSHTGHGGICNQTSRACRETDCLLPWLDSRYSDVVSSVHTTRVHGPCLSTALEHGCQVNTGVTNNDTRAFTGRDGYTGDHWPTRPVNTGVIFDTRVHGPWTRAVCTQFQTEAYAPPYPGPAPSFTLFHRCRN